MPDWQGVADDWLGWGIKGFDGLCGRIHRHASERPLTRDEREMIEHIVARLEDTLRRDQARQRGSGG